jgi:hypothetical protein
MASFAPIAIGSSRCFPRGCTTLPTNYCGVRFANLCGREDLSVMPASPIASYRAAHRLAVGQEQLNCSALACSCLLLLACSCLLLLACWRMLPLACWRLHPLACWRGVFRTEMLVHLRSQSYLRIRLREVQQPPVRAP